MNFYGVNSSYQKNFHKGFAQFNQLMFIPKCYGVIDILTNNAKFIIKTYLYIQDDELEYYINNNVFFRDMAKISVKEFKQNFRKENGLYEIFLHTDNVDYFTNHEGGYSEYHNHIEVSNLIAFAKAYYQAGFELNKAGANKYPFQHMFNDFRQTAIAFKGLNNQWCASFYSADGNAVWGSTPSISLSQFPINKNNPTRIRLYLFDMTSVSMTHYPYSALNRKSKYGLQITRNEHIKPLLEINKRHVETDIDLNRSEAYNSSDCLMKVAGRLDTHATNEIKEQILKQQNFFKYGGLKGQIKKYQNVTCMSFGNLSFNPKKSALMVSSWVNSVKSYYLRGEMSARSMSYKPSFYCVFLENEFLIKSNYLDYEQGYVITQEVPKMLTFIDTSEIDKLIDE